MKKLCVIGLIVSICIITFLQQIHPQSVVALQTVPSRTPTPAATATKSAGNGGNNPTNTAVAPTTTPTETPIPVTAAATPEGGYYPTAAPCSNHPTLIASNNTNVRSGPGTEFDILGQIVFLEVRPIIGRAQNAEWWLITLVDGTEGWVFDDVVTISGYTDIVPVVSSPAVDGPPWNPTPNPSCTVTPTPIPTETPSPTATNTLEPLPTDTTVLAEAATATAVPPTEPPTLVPQPTRVTDKAEATPMPTAVPLEEESNAGGNTNWLFIGAIGLLLVGGIIYFVTRGK